MVNARTNQAEAEAVAREVRERGVKALAVLADLAKKDRSTRWWRGRCPSLAVDILINDPIRPRQPFTEVERRGLGACPRRGARPRPLLSHRR